MTAGRRAVALAALVLAALGTSRAFAAGLSVTSRLGAGVTATTTCGAVTGATTSWTISAGNVTAVTITGLPASCNGARALLTLARADGTDAATNGGGMVSGGVASFSSLTSSPPLASVTAVQLALVGP